MLFRKTLLCVACLCCASAQIVPSGHNGVTLTPLDPVVVDDSSRSTGNSARAIIDFVNQSGRPVDIYWINEQGKRVVYRSKLANGDTYSVPTYLGHPWLVVASGTGGTTARRTGERLAAFQAQTPNPNNDPSLRDIAIIAAATAATPAAAATSPVQSDGVYNVGNGVTAPVLINTVEPSFSDVARKLSVDQVKVMLSMVVQPDGTATNFQVIGSVGYGLDESAIDAARQWRFKPGTKDGTPVPTRFSAQVAFRLTYADNLNLWHSGAMAFTVPATVEPPVVEDGSLPEPGLESSNESVILEFTVGADGSVKNVHGVYGAESSAALLGQYVAGWKFRPAIDGPKIVEATGRVRFVKGAGDEAVNRPLFSNAPVTQARALAPAPADQNTSAIEILQKVAQEYRRLSSIHLSGKFEEVQVTGNRRSVSEASYDLAAQGTDHHFLKVKLNGEEAISATDGQSTWKALASRKQWSRSEAATVSDEGEDQVGDQSKKELFVFISGGVFAEYPFLARIATNAFIEREADYKLGSSRVPCFVITAQIGKVQNELWVDKERFLVLERTEKVVTPTTLQSIRYRTVSIEVNQKMPDSAFRLEPAKSWSQVDEVLLPGEQGQSMAGQRAARFTLKTLDGERVPLLETQGRPVLLDFWATWCGPCRAELPTIEKLRSEFAESLFVYGINEEDPGLVKGFMKKNGYQMTVLMDSARQVKRLYGVHAFPTMLIIDKHGFIRNLYIGTRDEATLRRAIEAVVNSN